MASKGTFKPSTAGSMWATPSALPDMMASRQAAMSNSSLGKLGIGTSNQ